ncbi:MAG: redoxin family protein [Lysobacteraceae bacterium]
MRVVLLAIVLSLLSLPAAFAANVEAGAKPPDQLGLDVEGKPVQLSAQAGQVVIVTFWASWCRYCMKELPVLESIQKLAGPQRPRVIAVNSGERRYDFLKLAHKVKSSGLTLTSDATHSISDAYGVSGLPHLFLIDPKGVVVNVHVGYGEEELPSLVDEINGLLRAEATHAQVAPVNVGPGA